MANNYFNFKEFTIQQHKSAMKVCTDSCLFGAWVAQKIQGDNINYILDVGTGTGLLSLMLAQKIPSHIDAVEIETDAAEQAAENFILSPWKKRLHIFNTCITDFEANNKYELIITNPPFFENDLTSPLLKKNIAKHESGLTVTRLMAIFDKCLAKDGKVALLVPYHRMDQFESAAIIDGFYVEEKVLLKQSPEHDYFRVVLLLSRLQQPMNVTIITIHDDNRKYTDAFSRLLKDYYFNL